MKCIYSFIPAMFALSTAAFGGNHDPKAIAAALPKATLSLLDGIAKSEASNGPATSAKFEIDDNGQLVLSVYNVAEGLAVSPESATLMEVVYIATQAEPVASVEVFADKQHIARAASHMTLFQLSKLTLSEVVQAAISFRNGTPIDVRNPLVREHQPVADVIMLDSYNEPFIVTVNLANGRASKRK